jgi:hypothetical protein
MLIDIEKLFGLNGKAAIVDEASVVAVVAAPRDVNLRGPFIAIREAVRIMRADRTDGRIGPTGGSSLSRRAAPATARRPTCSPCPMPPPT